MNMNYAAENKHLQCDLMHQDEEDDGDDDTNNRISSRKLLSLGRAFRLTYSPVYVFSPNPTFPFRFHISSAKLRCA